MRLADLIETIMEKVQDPSLDSKRIRRMINVAIQESASILTDPLPDCETRATLTTSLTNPHISLPDNFHRDLDFCFNVTRNDRVEIYRSLPYLSAVSGWENLDDESSVYGVARSGRTLYYQGIPTTAETLTIHYFRKPTELERDNDEPWEFPSYCHQAIIVNHVLKELFSEIEDGIEQQKVNTAYHDKQWQDAVRALEIFMGPRNTEPPQIHDMVTELMY
jgi:hypothetical protein